MFYRETKSDQNVAKSARFPERNFKENMDLIFEFRTIDNENSNIENWRLC